MKKPVINRRSVLAACVGALSSPFALAQKSVWPSKPVKLIVPSMAGGPTDIFARIFADQLSKSLGQPFVVDNKAGATGMIGNNAVAKAPADGYTLLFSYAAATVMNQALGGKLPYDLVRDLQPIAQIGSSGVLLVVTSNFPAHNIREFVDVVKANPGKYDFGTWGSGSGGHLLMEVIMAKAGIKLQHVTYKAPPAIVNDMLGGSIQVGWMDGMSVMPHLQSGKMRPLLCSGQRRLPLLPDVPTMMESGFEVGNDSWYGMFAPARTPMPIIHQLNAEVNRILQLPEVKAKFKALNTFEGVPKTIEQFTTTIRDDIAVWTEVVRKANIKRE